MEEKNENNNLSLIVRIKRKREEESNNTICIIETEQLKKTKITSITKEISKLTTNNSNNSNNNNSHNNNDNKRKARLFLRKVNTIIDPNNIQIEEIQNNSNFYNNNNNNNNQNDDNNINDNKSNNKKRNYNSIQYVVTSSERVIENSKNIFMVDMSHIYTQSINTTNNNNTSSNTNKINNNNVSPKKGVKIFDPATRALHSAFSLQNPTDIFDQILQALELGADVNSQRNSDGLSALMIAAQYSNIRLVSKLLQKGANVYLQNQDAKSAIDFAEYADIENRSDASKQVLFLLRHAASSQYHTQQQQLQQSQSKSQSSSDKSSNDKNDDFVYDIYMIDKSIPLDLQSSNDMENDEQINSTGTTDETVLYPTIEVPGIRIVDGDITGDVTFYYDSDWSDLADDEDPDSNDEKFFGNDYPDEDWGEDENDQCYRDRDNYCDYDGDGDGNNDYYNDNQSDNEDNDNDDEDMYYRNRQARWKPDQEHDIHNNYDDDGDIDNYGDESGKIPKFDRNNIGRVLKPFIVNESLMSGGQMLDDVNQVNVDKLWSLKSDNVNEDIDNEAHQNRLDDMAHRTGMNINTSKHEFHSNGLPKYGQDLSDDDHDSNWIYSNDRIEDRKNNYNFEAYDSDDQNEESS